MYKCLKVLKIIGRQVKWHIDVLTITRYYWKRFYIHGQTNQNLLQYIIELLFITMWGYWPITLFWKSFGVFPVTLNNHRVPVLLTTFLLVSSPFLFIFIPTIVCDVGMKCTTDSMRILKEIYPGVLNITSTFSRIALLYCVRYKFPKYKKILESYETYSPTSAADVERYKTFTLVSVLLCVGLSVMANVFRFHQFLNMNQPNALVLVLFLYVFVQNLSMCCSETQFAEHCFVLYCKLRNINREIIKLKLGLLMNFSRYLCSLHTNSGSPAIAVDIDARGDPQDGTRSVANAIEALRIRHWLIREAIGCLNSLFGIQLGMSVCTLCIMSFFDIYYETFQEMDNNTLSTVVMYTLQFHFAVRYIGIILISHFTTKQVIGILPIYN